MSESDSALKIVKSPKRRREDEGSPEKRSVKRRKNKKPKDIADEDVDMEKGINNAIPHMDGRLLSDYVAQRTKRFQPELSMVELEDLYIPAKAILDTTNWTKPRTLENLPEFLDGIAKNDLSSAPESKGSPHTIVVCAAGLRAADVTRALRKYQSKEALVGKLFAKHIKLKESVEFCKRARINFGVGTPQRLSDLLDNGALSPCSLERIIVDASHIDEKKRSILDMKDTLPPLVKLLTRPEFKQHYGVSKNPLQLIFY